MNRSELQELLPLVALGIASLEEQAIVTTALQTDLELRLELRELELALSGVGATAPVTPPPALKVKLMEAIRQDAPVNPQPFTAQSSTPQPPAARVAPRSAAQSAPQARSRVAPRPRVLAGLLGAGTAVLAALALLVFAPPAGVNASAVATTGDGGLIFANSGETARVTPAVLVRPDRSRLAVHFTVPQPSVFTAATSSGGVSYLLDARNNSLFIVDERTGKLLDTWAVPVGAAGVAVAGDTVVVKGAISGTAVIFRKTGASGKTMLTAQIAPTTDMAMNDVMDATAIVGDRIYATHHVTGEVSVLERSTGRELARYRVGGKPVSLAVRGEMLLVLDYGGRLLKLNRQTGKVLQTVQLQGTPDRLTLMDDLACLSDRAGFVTTVSLESLAVLGRVKLEGVPMDLSPMPGDHLAVAVSKRGVVVLDRDLKQLETIN